MQQSNRMWKMGEEGGGGSSNGNGFDETIVDDAVGRMATTGGGRGMIVKGTA
jgi:hypothetical protein